jgi:hypothetical protein
VKQAAGKTLLIRGQVDPCGTHLRFDAVTGAASMVPGVAPTPYQSPVMAEESFCGAEVPAIALASPTTPRNTTVVCRVAASGHRALGGA